MAGTNPVVTYRKIDRYSKQFEPIFGDVIKEGFFKIPAAEIEAVGYGDAEEVPEGVAVKLAVPGTGQYKNAVYVTYEEGDLEICDVDDADVYGLTLQKIVPIGTNFPYKRKDFQSSIFRGEYVGIATGHFIAMLMSINVTVGCGSTTPAVRDYLYVGNKGILSLNGENGASNTGKKVAQILSLDRIPVNFSDGQPKSGESHKEIMVKCALAA
jgi:hypothetical protein